MTEHNKQIANALRAAADRIEAMGDVGEIDVEINLHGTKTRQQLTNAIAAADRGSISQASNHGSHWATFKICGIDAAAYFPPEALGQVRTAQVTTYKTTTASVLDLVADREVGT